MAFSLLTVQACSVHHKQTAGMPMPGASVVKSLFQQDSQYTFKTHINAYDNKISGLLWIKRIGPATYRVVIGNESGFQLAAMEFEGGRMRSHKVFKKLDHKIVLKTMEEGMRMIFYESICPVITVPLDAVYVNVKCGMSKFHYKIHLNELEAITRVESFEKEKLSATAEFEDFNNRFPEHISIRFEQVKLKWELALIQS